MAYLPPPLHVPTVWKSGSHNLLEPSGPVTGLYRGCFTFYLDIGPTSDFTFYLDIGPTSDFTLYVRATDQLSTSNYI